MSTPAEIADNYMRIMHTVEMSQMIEILGAELNLSDKLTRATMKQSVARGRYFIINEYASAFSLNPNESYDLDLRDALWVYITFLKDDPKNTRILSRNNYKGIDFDRAGQFTRIIPIKDSPEATVRQLCIDEKEYAEPASYVFLVPSLYHYRDMKTVYPTDTLVSVSVMQKEPPLITFSQLQEEQKSDE